MIKFIVDMTNNLSQIITDITRVFYKTSDYFIKVVCLILLFFEEVRFVLTGVLILIMADQITGVWKAFVAPNKFKWNIFNRFYPKLILYLVALMSCFIFEEYIVDLDTHYFTKGLAAVIGFQELSSVALNVATILGKTYIHDYIKTIKEKLK